MESLQEALEMKPQILILNCHGLKAHGKTQLYFESKTSKDSPTKYFAVTEQAWLGFWQN
jgi:hypothetical protein